MILFHTEAPGRERAGAKLFSESAPVGVLAFRHDGNATNLTQRRLVCDLGN
jgi:hypothetical protein